MPPETNDDSSEVVATDSGSKRALEATPAMTMTTHAYEYFDDPADDSENFSLDKSQQETNISNSLTVSKTTTLPTADDVEAVKTALSTSHLDDDSMDFPVDLHASLLFAFLEDRTKEMSPFARWMFANALTRQLRTEDVIQSTVASQVMQRYLHTFSSNDTQQTQSARIPPDDSQQAYNVLSNIKSPRPATTCAAPTATPMAEYSRDIVSKNANPSAAAPNGGA
jgi:hypothetical protein